MPTALKSRVFQGRPFRQGLCICLEFVRVSKLCAGIADELMLPFWRLFENVVPSPSETVWEMNRALDLGAPFLVDAADLGWISRRRLVWADSFWPPAWEELVNEETFRKHRWLKVSVPRRRHGLPVLGSVFKSSYKPSMLSRRGSPDHPEGRMPVLTRLLDGQPPHGFQRASQSARQRCQEDGVRLS